MRRPGLLTLPAKVLLAWFAASALLLPAVIFIRGGLTETEVTFERPTALTFGPDGRLYVAEQEGRIRAFTVGPSPGEIDHVQRVASSSDLQEVFGIAFDPADTSSPPPVYVTNTVSGLGDDGLAPARSYPGKITKIHGIGYSSRTDIITGLPVSNFAHQSNGLVFTEDGTLLIAQGSSTNAGLPDGPFLWPEGPLSAAVLVAHPFEPGFDGGIAHVRRGASVDQFLGDVSVYASGLRNPYDLIIHSNGRIYLTDNAPNVEAGAASASCDGQTTDAEESDELNIIEEGNYYGHPNLNRGRFDPRQCVYHSGAEGSGPDWTGPIAVLPPSSNGLVEYTADTFGGKLKGNLLYVSYIAGVVGRIVLSPGDGTVASHTELIGGFGSEEALDITMGPDGTLYIAEYRSGNIVTFRPDDWPDDSLEDVPRLPYEAGKRLKMHESVGDRVRAAAGPAAAGGAAALALGYAAWYARRRWLR